LAVAWPTSKSFAIRNGDKYANFNVLWRIVFKKSCEQIRNHRQLSLFVAQQFLAFIAREGHQTIRFFFIV